MQCYGSFLLAYNSSIRSGLILIKQQKQSGHNNDFGGRIAPVFLLTRERLFRPRLALDEFALSTPTNAELELHQR